MTWAAAAQKDAFGSWGYWSIPNGNGYRVPCLWQRKILALGILGVFFFGGEGMAYLSFPMGVNGLGMSFCNPGASFCSVVSQALPATLFSIVAALLLSMARTQELSSRDACALSTLLPTPKSCQSQWPPGASSEPGKQGTDVCNSFLFTFFFFSGVGLSNYSVVYANTEGALGASSGALLLLGNSFIF